MTETLSAALLHWNRAAAHLNAMCEQARRTGDPAYRQRIAHAERAEAEARAACAV